MLQESQQQVSGKQIEQFSSSCFLVPGLKSFISKAVGKLFNKLSGCCLIYTMMNEYINVTKYNIDWQDLFTGKITVPEIKSGTCGTDWKAY